MEHHLHFTPLLQNALYMFPMSPGSIVGALSLYCKCASNRSIYGASFAFSPILQMYYICNPHILPTSSNVLKT